MSGPASDLRPWLRERLFAALEAAGFGGELPNPAAVALELPREFAHGDLACPAAFAVAKAARKAPREVAEAIAAQLRSEPRLAKVEVAGGGYVNLFLGEAVWRDLLGGIAAAGETYGSSATLSGQRFLVEFISANPTGPLVVANARYAAFGESLCRCLEAAGAVVEREYYVNDAGQQIRNLALSLDARWKQSRGEAAELPKDGYQGDYVVDLAKAIFAAHPELPGLPETRRLAELARLGVAAMCEQQRLVIERLRVVYTRWFSEKSLHDGGAVDAAFEKLKGKDLVYQQEGAWWFKAKQFGDEKDRVVRRSDGAPTYQLPDIAYHLDKLGRGYDRLINIVGADHQVEMATLKKALGALGEDADRLEVIIVQFVNLKRGAEKVVMSKRSGNVILLDELVDEVGVDAARFLFLTRAPSSHLDFDLELAKSTTMDNPVYYLQYAHARLSSLIERAAAEGLAVPPPEAADVALLAEPETKLLLRQLARYPLLVEKAAASRQPHLLAHELLELAAAIHGFYTQCRVVGAETPGHATARLALAAAARQVLRNGLALLGVGAPERM